MLIGIDLISNLWLAPSRVTLVCKISHVINSFKSQVLICIKNYVSIFALHCNISDNWGKSKTNCKLRSIDLYLSKSFSNSTFPESMMKRTPSMVTEVSAMFVDTMHFLTPSGGKSNTCKNTIQSEEYIGVPSKQLHLKESPLLVIITVPWRQILTHYIFIQIWYWKKKAKGFFSFYLMTI